MKRQRSRADVYEIFQTVAPRYDRANARISLGLEQGWKKLLVKRLLAGAGPGQQILDVCCGTGDIAIAAARRATGTRVTGLDFSPAMLAVAREKGRGLSNLQWVQGDAMELPFPDGTFSAACISFGLRNTPDHARVLREMSRVVQPGGKVYCLDSFVPDNPVILPAYRLYFRYLMPVLGGGRKYRQQYTWLYQSTQQFPRRKKLMRQFARTGLAGVQSRSRMFGACVLIEGTKPVEITTGENYERRKI
ncbi:MAG: ubiquinone/menaquinone biosynthesis methyltransferase [Eubacteriales bacterium]|nr:ubiquinone/menaquinone biosynthesis methyltransferase [Eubacteriales bacterium]